MENASILIVAGERSGDLYGAALARALKDRRSDLAIFGCGGEAMRAAGVETIVDAHQVAAAGIVEVLPGLARIYTGFHRLLDEAAARQPALAVLIDFPDFNIRLAQRLKRKGIPVVYFVSPQVWAWRRGRLKQLKEVVDQMLCLFEFEEAIYREAGIPVEVVGHPLVDLARPKLSRAEWFATTGLDPQARTVAMLPGSRTGEVSRILPPMLDAAQRLAAEFRVQFALAAAPTIEEDWVRRLIQSHGGNGPEIRIVRDLTDDALAYSDAAMVASGTATLNATLAERPMVVVYRVSPLTWLAGKLLVRVPYFSMVNILAGSALVPELMQSECNGKKIRERLSALMSRGDLQDSMKAGLRLVRQKLGPPGAAGRAAEAILRFLPASAGILDGSGLHLPQRKANL